MGTKSKRWPVPLLSAIVQSLYGIILFALAYFLDGHVKVDTFLRAVWTSAWSSLICYHLAWYISRGHLPDRGRIMSVIKFAVFFIILIGGVACLIATSMVHDWLAAIPCVPWIIACVLIMVVEYQYQFKKKRNTEHEMIQNLLNGDPEVSGSLAYTPYGGARKRKPWYRNIVMQLLCMLIALVLLFFGFLTVYGLGSFANDTLYIKPYGKILSVNVGGDDSRSKTDDMFNMHIYCEGSRSAKYNFTIILEHGGGTAGISMMPLQSALSNLTRVCVYDRPGAGWSQLDRGFIRAGDAPREAHQLFRLAGEYPPYVIGGHSAGGGYALEFREIYPNEVAGIFFIDSYPLGEVEEKWAAVDGSNFAATMKSRLRMADLMRWFAPLGLTRWFLGSDTFPDELRAAQLWSVSNPVALNTGYWVIRSMVAQNDDISVLPQELIQNVTAGYLADLPLLVMAAVKDPSKTTSCDALPPPKPADQAACEIELKILAVNWNVALAESKISTQGSFVPCDECSHSMAWDRVFWIKSQVMPWLDTIDL